MQAENMAKRYNSLAVHCRGVNPSADLTAFVRSMGSIPAASSTNKFTFVPPRNPPNIPSEMKVTASKTIEVLFYNYYPIPSPNVLSTHFCHRRKYLMTFMSHLKTLVLLKIRVYYKSESDEHPNSPILTSIKIGMLVLIMLIFIQVSIFYSVFDIFSASYQIFRDWNHLTLSLLTEKLQSSNQSKLTENMWVSFYLIYLLFHLGGGWIITYPILKSNPNQRNRFFRHDWWESIDNLNLVIQFDFWNVLARRRDFLIR